MKLTILAAVLAAAACAPQPEADMDPPPSAATPGADQRGPIPVRRFDDATSTYIRSSSGLAEAGRQVVRDEAAWHGLWARATEGGPTQRAPAVDFGREMVLVAAMGRRATGGYTVAIEGVDEEGGEWVVRVQEQRPGPRCGTTQAITAPADMVAVPRTDRPIRWAVREGVTDCP